MAFSIARRCAPFIASLPIGTEVEVTRGISAGDRVASYSPTTELGRADKLQSFVSIGVVHGNTPCEADMGN